MGFFTASVHSPYQLVDARIITTRILCHYQAVDARILTARILCYYSAVDARILIAGILCHYQALDARILTTRILCHYTPYRPLVFSPSAPRVRPETSGDLRYDDCVTSELHFLRAHANIHGTSDQWLGA